MKVYLDNNRATKTDEQVIGAMEPFLQSEYGDPMASHGQSIEMRQGLKLSLEKIAASLHARSEDEFCFSSSNDESNYKLFMAIYLSKVITGQKNHIIISERESKTIQEATMFFASQGCKVTVISVDENGLIDLGMLKDSISPKCALVSISMVDRQDGAIMPMDEISSICKEHGVALHSDASYAMGKVPIDVQMIDIDYLTIGSHAIHGPAGTSLMYVKNGGMLDGLRQPVKNGANVIGMAKALELSSDAIAFEMEDVRELRDELEEHVREIDGHLIVVPWANRSANVLVAGFADVHAQLLAWHLNKSEIYVDTQEHVELAESLKVDAKYKHTLLTFALSRYTTKDEIEYIKKKLSEAIKEIRQFVTYTMPKDKK